MDIFQLTTIGEFHTNHNEDFLIVEEAGKSYRMIAVMDGCSSGTDSHLASTLIGKILRKVAKQEAYREYAQREKVEIKVLIQRISLQLFEDLYMLNRMLDLRSDELLSTLILSIVDIVDKQAELVIVGDGVVQVNGEYIEYENDNKPDYVGYHLNMDKHLWYQTRTNKKSVSNLLDMTISTDGIHTFRNFDGAKYPEITEDRIRKEFFEDLTNLENSNKLKLSLLKIKEEYGLCPSDDLTMIRVVSK